MLGDTDTSSELWFDVGIKRYTTATAAGRNRDRCGLMQESKDIQRGVITLVCPAVVV